MFLTTKDRMAHYFRYSFMPIFVYAPLVGICSGVTIFLFKFIAHYVAEFSLYLYALARSYPQYLPIFIVGLFGIGAVITLILRFCPNIKGGGIARVKGALRGLITFKWLRTLMGTFVSSLLGFFAGLPLGTEGPSVMMGAAVGKGINEISKHSHPALNRYLMTGGAGAGFAVATGAPLAGIVFILEEVHKRFSFYILFIAVSSVIFACLVSETLISFINIDLRLINIATVEMPPLNQIGIAFIIGLIAGLAIVLFNKLMVYADKLSTTMNKVPRYGKIMFSIILTSVICFFVDYAHGMGQDLIDLILQYKLTIGMIMILLSVKLITVILSLNSGITGGLFVPVLVIGALLGGLISSLLGSTGEKYIIAIVCITMCVFLGGVMNAPITAMVFIMETTAQLHSSLYYIIAMLVAFGIIRVLDTKSINNNTLLMKLLRQKNKDKTAEIFVLTAEVQPDSFVINRSTRDILWPPNCMIRTTSRSTPSSTTTTVHSGEDILLAKDKLLIQAQTYDKEQTLKELAKILGKQDFSFVTTKKQS